MRTTMVMLLALTLAGCNATIGPKGMRGGGDSDQEVLSISGKGSISQLPTDATEGWKAECESDQCEITWITQNQANAQRDVQLVEAAGEIAVKAMAAALP